MLSSTPRTDIATHFVAMATPCVILVDTDDHELGTQIGRIVMDETQRIEAKYSRYRPTLITAINESAGDRTEVDSETADLLDYAASCYELSGGSFDITSGALRRIWRFDGSGLVPTAAQVDALLRVIGWNRVSWHRPLLQLAPGMEIDFGGIGKEYAVDRAMMLIQSQMRTPPPCLINLGADLRVSGPRRDGSGWRIGIEDAERHGERAGLIELSHGAVATSGDTYRYIVVDGVRHGHVLDPRTGRPVPGAPRSVTVHAATCSEAGLIAKLALLSGAGAENILCREGVRAWCYR